MLHLYHRTAGIERGQLEALRKDLSQQAGMAAALCRSAGWWQLEALLASLAQQAAVGARPELLPLMQARGCDGDFLQLPNCP